MCVCVSVYVCILSALYAVKVRAEAMQAASEQTPSGMLSVIGKPQAKYNQACLLAREHCMSLGIPDPVCMVANYLFPDGRVIAGHQEVGYKHHSCISLTWWTRPVLLTLYLTLSSLLFAQRLWILPS